MRRAPILLLAVAACAGARGPTRPAPAARHAIVISIDGLMPASILEADARGLRIPTLRALAAGGRLGSAVAAFPSVTYPNHISMVTGVSPARHGIVNNRPFDPEERNQEGWYWYAEDLRAPTLWDAASAAGLRVALLSWPVTVGARAAVVVPEIWRAGTGDDQKLVRALSSPGVLDGAARRFPDLWRFLTPPATRDVATTDVAVHVLETARPDLLLVHIFELDTVQHEFGPGSPEAARAIENADAQVARMIAAARAAGSWATTLLVVVSDHGFMRIDRCVRPGALLREAGLVTLDERGKVVSWRAGVSAAGGIALIYLADPADAATGQAVTELFARQAATPGSGIGRVYAAAELAARGSDPRAFLAIEATPGTVLVSGSAGPVSFPANHHGHHGYDPERPEMLATFLLAGPAVGPGALPAGIRLVDVAPTVAAWLGLSMPAVEGVSRLPR